MFDEQDAAATTTLSFTVLANDIVRARFTCTTEGGDETRCIWCAVAAAATSWLRAGDRNGGDAPTLDGEIMGC